jgi:hypothetical protein
MTALCPYCAWTGDEPYFPFVSAEKPRAIKNFVFYESDRGAAFCPQCGAMLQGVCHESVAQERAESTLAEHRRRSEATVKSVIG